MIVSYESCNIRAAHKNINTTKEILDHIRDYIQNYAGIFWCLPTLQVIERAHDNAKYQRRTVLHLYKTY